MTDLAGKDYFTVEEAAHYCCVSLSQFRAKIKESGLLPGKQWGKNIYRRSDLQKLIEETAWQPSNGARTGANQERSRNRPTLIGATGASSAARV